MSYQQTEAANRKLLKEAKAKGEKTHGIPGTRSRVADVERAASEAAIRERQIEKGPGAGGSGPDSPQQEGEPMRSAGELAQVEQATGEGEG